jgi:hypothetical protein
MTNDAQYPVRILLALLFVAATVRFTFDPTLSKLASFFGIENLVTPDISLILIVSAAAVSASGAVIVPLFWFYVLGIRIERRQFVRAMIFAYAPTALVFDSTSPMWLSLVNVGTIPAWLPDLARTIIVTAYSWFIGKSILRHPLGVTEPLEYALEESV